MSLIKTSEEIGKLRVGGRELAIVLKKVAGLVQPGITTGELNQVAEELIAEIGGVPSFKGYGEPIPFPTGLCTSINEQIVHGIPSQRVLQSGDIISLDIGMEKDGLFTDMALTVPVGKISKEAKKLLKVTNRALVIGMKQCRVNNTLGDIGWAIQQYVEKNGFQVVRDLVGHGVGHAVHEEPTVPNFGVRSRGMKLEPGMVLALEPMVTIGDYNIEYEDDNWTIRTRDHSLSGHFEHTVAITSKGPIVITSL